MYWPVCVMSGSTFLCGIAFNMSERARERARGDVASIIVVRGLSSFVCSFSFSP